MDFYRNALIYHALHAQQSAAQFDILLQLAAQFNAAHVNARWLEPACGSGRLLEAASNAGFDIWGFDLEPKMVDFARQLCPNVESKKIFCAAFQDFEQQLSTASFDFSYCPINSIRHLQSDQHLLQHLSQMATVLKAGAVYVVGLHTTSNDGPQEDEEVICSSYQSLQLTGIEQSFPIGERSERIYMHLTVANEEDSSESYKDYSFDLRTYSREQWREVVAGSAFEEISWCDWYLKKLPTAAIGYGYSVLRAR